MHFKTETLLHDFKAENSFELKKFAVNKFPFIALAFDGLRNMFTIACNGEDEWK
jgi:hypothetical protein